MQIALVSMAMMTLSRYRRQGSRPKDEVYVRTGLWVTRPAPRRGSASR